MREADLPGTDSEPRVASAADEEIPSINQKFDLVMSAGVLHHMASPQTGMDGLASVLQPDGVAAIMLYARYGRIGVEMMQAVFHEMGMQQTEDSLRLVRAGLSWLDPSHAARAYTAIAPDLAFDTGMVDGSGLVFQDWLAKTPLHPPTLVGGQNEFLAAVSTPAERQMWSVMERLRNLTACHLFLACRRERPTADYVIDFSVPHAVNYVPLWRMQAGIDGQQAVRPNWAIPLAEQHREMALHVDGNLSITEISERCAQPVADTLELFMQL